MEARFSLKVKSAAVAAWWTILIAFSFILFQWLIYRYFNAHPQGLISVLLGGFDWQFIRVVWLWSVAVLKLCMWLLLLVTIWLTLWARALAKSNC
jgi:hypothetical protein